jgi:thiamine-monophosphate kinase
MGDHNVEDLGEFGVIEAVTKQLPTSSGVLLGPGDDAAVVEAPDGRVVVTTDLLLENRHFRRDWSSARDVGRKAAAQNLSDIAAMGARPTAVTAGLGLPPDLPVEWVRNFEQGLADECDTAGAAVVGGDISKSDSILVAITALGSLDGRAPVTRSGARPGDVLAVCGRIGWAEAGLRILSRGFRTPRVLVDAHRVPNVPYDAGPEAAELGATAMCDVSDGLVADVGHISTASSVRVDIETAALEVADPLRDTAAALGADPLEWILGGGDDNALAATFPAAAALPARWRVIGRVLEGDAVTVNGEPYTGGAGYTHFR